MKKAIVLLLSAILAAASLPAFAQEEKKAEKKKPTRAEARAERREKREAAREAKRNRNISSAPEATEKK